MHIKAARKKNSIGKHVIVSYTTDVHTYKTLQDKSCSAVEGQEILTW